MDAISSLFTGGIGLIVVLLIIYWLILSLLIPFYIARIRQETINMNASITKIFKLLEAEVMFKDQQKE